MTEDATEGGPNPATDLLEIFNAWATSDKPTNHTRRHMNSTSGLYRHVRAMNLVQETVRAIDALEARGRNVRIYRASQDAWVSAVLVRGTGSWTGNSDPRADFNDVMMNALEGLADVLDHPSGPSDARAAVLATLLDDVAKAARDTAIDPRLTAHIMKVVNRLREYLHDFENISPEAANEAWEAAWAAASAAVSQTSGEDRTRWEKLRDSFMMPTASGFIASAPALALQIAQMSAGA